MTMRRFRDKNPEGRLRLIEQPLVSPKAKVHQQQITPMTDIQDLKSVSRGKHKLKRHIFKSPNLHLDDPFSNQHRREPLKSYSSFGTLPQENDKPKFNARQFLAERNALPSGSNKVNKQKLEGNRKEKRQFKLIHQIKMQKASRMHEQKKILLNRPKKTESETAIESASNDKMDDFVQEIQLILEPNEKPSSSINEAPSIVVAPQEYKLQSIKEQKGPVPSQSAVVITIPSLIQKSQYKSQVRVKAVEEEHKTLDLNRSLSIAQRLLKKRRDSCSSIDINLKQSKVRAQISISLALESVHNSRRDLSTFYRGFQCKKGKNELATCKQKIYTHLQILQSMSNFVYQSTKFDEIGEQWQELNFLIYKKFYIERRKVLNFIQKYPMRNPFCIYNAEIGSKEVIEFMKTEEGALLLRQLKKQTSEIKEKLTKIYGRFCKAKVGEKINLYEYDNFNHWIVEQLWAELILTEHNISHSRQTINIRLCRIMQLIFLISQINGKFECGFDQAEQAIEQGQCEEYIKEGKHIFERYILYKEEDSDNVIL